MAITQVVEACCLGENPSRSSWSTWRGDTNCGGNAADRGTSILPFVRFGLDNVRWVT